MVSAEASAPLELCEAEIWVIAISASPLTCADGAPRALGVPDASRTAASSPAEMRDRVFRRLRENEESVFTQATSFLRAAP